MKSLTILLFGLFFTITVSGQSSEFEIYPNGLIYSEQAMAKLSHIVDSLNLQFKVCDFNKVFYSKNQTIGHLVNLKEVNVKEAKKDMENQIPLDDFLKKYPDASIERNILIVKYKYKDYNEQEIVDMLI